MRLDIFIFSFNRGPWLSNLCDSIRKYFNRDIDLRIIIFDDYSSDQFTIEVLEREARKGATIFHAQDFDVFCRGSRGGLHAGIEAALSKATRPGAFALLLQDDMLIIRSVSFNDITHFCRISQESGNPFVYVNFWTGGLKQRTSSMTWKNGYFIKYSRRENSYRHYTDVCFVHMEMFKQASFKFHNSEKLMENEAAKLFKPMAWSPYPIVAMLPDPIVNREGIAFSGSVYKFVEWSDQQQNAFLQRDPIVQMPVAEEFLKIEGHVLPTPWGYGIETKNLQRIIRRLKRFFVQIKGSRQS